MVSAGQQPDVAVADIVAADIVAAGIVAAGIVVIGVHNVEIEPMEKVLQSVPAWLEWHSPYE